MKSLLFVDDETRVLQALQRQLHPMRRDWEMRFAESGEQALRLMETAPADVIVTDMRMPAMDGAQLLDRVMGRYPQTVRIVLSGQADRESVFRLVGPAHQYLSKPCEPDRLRSAIARAFQLRDLLTNKRLIQLASRLESLPSIPTLHAEISEELRKEDPSLERVAAIISKDLGMTTKMLQLVNSAFFGLPQAVSSTEEAVTFLGLSTVRALVLSLQLFAQFKACSVQGFSIEELAEHGWVTGVLARRIAELEHSEMKLDDQCFLAGLLHDVGRLVLANGIPDEYTEVLEYARSNELPIWEAETDRLGASHAEVGAYLLGLWGLPNPITEAVAFHHNPAQTQETQFSPVIAVHVANSFADEAIGRPTLNRIDHAYLQSIGLDRRLDEWREHCFRERL